MSRFFGEVRQAGYVVPDIEQAMKYWSEVLGVGPWFYAPQVPVVNFKYRGEISAPITSVALANSGPLQIELIQQRNSAPTMYQDFVKTSTMGLQHLAYWTTTYDADLARLQAQGFVVAMSGFRVREGCLPRVGPVTAACHRPASSPIYNGKAVSANQKQSFKYEKLRSVQRQ